jgi:hypothetical protein
MSKIPGHRRPGVSRKAAGVALALVMAAPVAAQAQGQPLAFGKYHCTVYGGVVVNGPSVGISPGERPDIFDVVLDGSWQDWGKMFGPSMTGVYKKNDGNFDYDLRFTNGSLTTLQIIYNNRPGYSRDATCDYRGR